LLPGLELMGCQGLSVPAEVMHHVVRVESSFNPYAIGVVGGRLVRQPRNLPEALATVRMLESRGFNFSIGLAQVNRYNLHKYGLDSYEEAFEPCANLTAGSKILAECYHRANGDWGKSFSCYYSGNFSTGFRHGYVQKIYASLRQGRGVEDGPQAPAIEVVGRSERRTVPVSRHPLHAAAGPDAPSRMPETPAVTATVSLPAAAIAQPAAKSRAERARDARVVPVSRTEQVAPEQFADAQAAQLPAQVSAVTVPPADQPPIGRAVPVGQAVPVGRAVPVGNAAAAAANPEPAPSPAPATRRGARGPDKAFVATEASDDDAFVF
jgi:type IV secretion system protein VirB1